MATILPLVIGLVMGVEDDLDSIPVTDRQPQTAYSREEHFGSGWTDIDRNGCDTRNDILRRDLDNIELLDPGASSCPDGTVATGILNDPYTGTDIVFDRATDPQAVQIDHIVALSYAWNNGADLWDHDTRIAFANDPRNLLAVDGPTNGSKSDLGPSQWAPATPELQCDYAVQFIDVATTYELSLPAEDIDALGAYISYCDPGSLERLKPQAADIYKGIVLIALWLAVLVIAFILDRKKRS